MINLKNTPIQSTLTENNGSLRSKQGDFTPCCLQNGDLKQVPSRKFTGGSTREFPDDVSATSK